MAPLDLDCNSPNAGDDLIRAHTLSDQLPPPADTAASDFSTSPVDSGYVSEDTPVEDLSSTKWSKQHHMKQTDLSEHMQGTSPNRVTGYVNPMFSSQSAKGIPTFEENPIFEM